MKKDREFNADSYCWQVRVRSAAHLDCWITDCFNGLNLKHQDDGTTVVTGELIDLPAVYGLVLQLRDSGVDLLSLQVKRQAIDRPGNGR